MNNEQLKQYNSSFTKKLSNEKDSSKIAELFERYYNFLKKELETAESKEEHALVSNAFYQLIYQMIVTVTSNGIKWKKLSKDWNGHLVSKTYNSKEISSMQLAELLKEIEAEKDFATKAYCYQVLQQDSIIDFSKMLITEKQLRTVQRPGFGGKTVPDDGSKYWHLDAKELMTYDECTEKGLGHHLLYYPVGHEWQNMSAGFMETDPSKVQKKFDKEAEKFLETVFVDEATLAD